MDGVRLHGRVELRGDEPLCFGETFATLAPGTLPSRRRRRTLAAGVGATAVLAAAGVTAGVLAPHTGSGPALATVAAPRAVPSQPAAPTEAPAEPVPGTEPPATTTAATEEAVAARLLFRDDFSDARSGWEVFDGDAVSAGYEKGEFVMRVNDASWYATARGGRSSSRSRASSCRIRGGRRRPGSASSACTSASGGSTPRGRHRRHVRDLAPAWRAVDGSER